MDEQQKIKKLDFRLDNVPRKYVVLGQAIVLVAKKLNEVIDVLNSKEKQS
jgi:hypothetical protein